MVLAAVVAVLAAGAAALALALRALTVPAGDVGGGLRRGSRALREGAGEVRRRAGAAPGAP